jgi:siroheme synthase
VVLTTGHRAQESAQLPAESGMATRVVYMPGRDLAQIAHEWLREGLPAELPCVLVSRASLPDESMQRTTLGELDSLAPLAAPSLLLAGWSVGKAGDRG